MVDVDPQRRGRDTRRTRGGRGTPAADRGGVQRWRGAPSLLLAAGNARSPRGRSDRASTSRPTAGSWLRPRVVTRAVIATSGSQGRAPTSSRRSRCRSGSCTGPAGRPVAPTGCGRAVGRAARSAAERREFAASWSEVGVVLEPGDRYYRCPFHDDRHPSLHVDAEGCRWYCFGCRRGGGPGMLGRLVRSRTRERRGHERVVRRCGTLRTAQPCTSRVPAAPGRCVVDAMARVRDRRPPGRRRRVGMCGRCSRRSREDVRGAGHVERS